METLALVLRLSVAALLVFAGTLKFSVGTRRLVSKISAFRLVPRPLVLLLAAALPVVEVFTGIGLAASGHTPWVIAGMAMLIGYTIAIASVLVRGITTECGCFGTLHESEASGLLIGRNLVLIAILAPSLTRHDYGILVPLFAIAAGAILVVLVAAGRLVAYRTAY